MRCTVIGCWGGCCRRDGACSGYLLQHGGDALLLDCGSGVASAVQNVIPLTQLNHVVVSHYHFDHCSDAGALGYGRLIAVQRGETGTPLTFYGPDDPAELARLAMPPYSAAHAVHTGDTLRIGPFACSFLRTKHPVECLAVRVECAGGVLVYTADGALTDELAAFAAGADVLITECSLYAGADGSRAGHMTCTDAARLALRAKPGTLVLSHLPVYGDVRELLGEVRSHWNGTTVLASRLLGFEIPQRKGGDINGDIRAGPGTARLFAGQ